MKKLLIVLLLTTVSFTLFAQLKPYQPNTVLDKFVGTWIAQTGKKTITITIKKIQAPFMNSKVDLLDGYLLHKDNGEILEGSDTPALTFGFNYDEDGECFQDSVFFNYFDQRKHKRGRLTITLSKENPDEFTADHLAAVEVIRIVTPSTPLKKIEKGFTLPNGLVFNRQQ
jgi:hypothetical protein